MGRRSRRGVLRRPPAEDRKNGGSRGAGRQTGRLLTTACHLPAHGTHRAPQAQPVRPSLVTQVRPAHRDAALQTPDRRDVASCRLDRAVRNARPLACVDGQARYLSVHLVRPPQWQSGCLVRCGRAGISAVGATARVPTTRSIGAAPTLAVARVFNEDAPVGEYDSQIVGGWPFPSRAGGRSIVKKLL